MARKGLDDDLNRFYGPPLKRDDLAVDFKFADTSGFKEKKPVHVHKSCYESHPPLKIPGTDLVIYGGSCLHPVVTDADVYIGFDFGMRFTGRNWPWKTGEEFLFEIQDMSVPKHPEEFKKLVEWTAQQLRDGKKVHAGCIGGHGRTGLFLSALVNVMSGEKDAISYVRKAYCERAVETKSQIDFLETHFGVLPVGGSKTHVKIVNGAAKKVKEFVPVVPTIASKHDIIAHLPGCSIWD